MPAQVDTDQSELTILVTKIISDEIIALASPTPFTCTSLPEGVSLDLNPLSSILVEIIVQGLQPNQEITVIFTSRSSGHKKLIEDRGVLTDSDGKYIDLQRLTPLSENGENHWLVSVIHADGIACDEITLTP